MRALNPVLGRHQSLVKLPPAVHGSASTVVRGGVLRVTWVTTTGIRGVGRDPIITSARTIRHSGLVVEHEFYEKLKKNT